ncbi:MAG: restriction endonuclease subunit R, partial [Candidatus Pacearchaeota archaeon]|nr:restriction endonuclease subunit R [Candidatus Pacearchaeota archaeon]
DYFTIYDFVDAYHHFADPEWDGEPLDPETCDLCGNTPCTCPGKPEKLCEKCGERPCVCEKVPKEACDVCGQIPCICRRTKKIRIKLADGKEREIQHMIATSFWSADGKPISAEEFLHNLFGTLPDFFKSEEDLRLMWSDPETRRALLEKLEEAGYGKDVLGILQKLINAEKSDLFDVLEYVSFAIQPITRELRVAASRADILAGLTPKQQEFIEFVLSKYIESGVGELSQEKLPKLLELQYHTLSDAAEILGGVDVIRKTFIAFQRLLYAKKVA